MIPVLIVVLPLATVRAIAGIQNAGAVEVSVMAGLDSSSALAFRLLSRQKRFVEKQVV